MTVRFNSPRMQAFDANGTPRSGAKLYFYEPSTTTPKDVYSDASLTTPISQPVVSSSAGLWQAIYMQGSTYRVILKDANNVTIWDEDNFDPGLAAGFGVSSVVGVAQGGTGATTAAAARANLEAASSEALTIVQDAQTENTALIETGLHTDGDRFGLLAKEDSVGISQLATGFGYVCIQRDKYFTITDPTIATTTPAYDTSNPQSTEGDIVFARAFTPLRSDSVIRITAYITGDLNASTGYVTMMLNKDAGNAVAADAFYCANNQQPFSGFLFHEESSASTSARTYRLRCGVSTSVFTVNGNAGSFNGNRKSYLLIEEWVQK